MDELKSLKINSKDSSMNDELKLHYCALFRVKIQICNY